MSRWTKVMGSLMAVALLATALAGVALAQEPGESESEPGVRAGRRFGLVNEEGITRRNGEECDGMPAYAGEGFGRRFGAGAKEDCDGEGLPARDGTGAGYGFGFVDEDGDGINDRCDDGFRALDGTGAGHRFGLGNLEGRTRQGGRGGQ